MKAASQEGIVGLLSMHRLNHGHKVWSERVAEGWVDFKEAESQAAPLILGRRKIVLEVRQQRLPRGFGQRGNASSKPSAIVHGRRHLACDRGRVEGVCLMSGEECPCSLRR